MKLDITKMFQVAKLTAYQISGLRNFGETQFCFANVVQYKSKLPDNTQALMKEKLSY